MSDRPKLLPSIDSQEVEWSFRKEQQQQGSNVFGTFLSVTLIVKECGEDKQGRTERKSWRVTGMLKQLLVFSFGCGWWSEQKK